jgi:hypothetical protein
VKSPFQIARRELFKKLVSSAGALGLAAMIPASAAAEVESPASGGGSATVRVILADGTTVQWMAATNSGLTVGGKTTITTGTKTLNASIVKAAIMAIVAAGGPHLSATQITLLGGQV